MEPTATAPSSIEQYHAIMCHMEYAMIAGQETETIYDAAQCKKLLRKLRKRLMCGLDAVVDAATDDLSMFEEGFILALEPLAKVLDVSDHDTRNKVFWRFCQAQRMVAWFKEALHRFIAVEQLEAELEAAQCELFAY